MSFNKILCYNCFQLITFFFPVLLYSFIKVFIFNVLNVFILISLLSNSLAIFSNYVDNFSSTTCLFDVLLLIIYFFLCSGLYEQAWVCFYFSFQTNSMYFQSKHSHHSFPFPTHYSILFSWNSHQINAGMLKLSSTSLNCSFMHLSLSLS